ncbi:hypothetical protein [Glycomyces tenuis]|uniref:hypothetical protein n=1 Tax=Glycomyces tenuis TaxID=58116 RepID=UPI000426ECA7|nr:hypothetical protein [Glycomyces tenuis]
MSGSPTARLRLVGILFWLAGGAVITFGWMGMAEVGCVDCQMPYLVSGGAAGLGLIVVGSTLVLASVVLDAAERTARRAAELLKAVAEESEDEVRAQEEAREPAEAAQEPK